MVNSLFSMLTKKASNAIILLDIFALERGTYDYLQSFA